MNFLGKGFQKLEHCKQAQTETDATERITTPYLRMVSLGL